ncbi:MAG: Hsp20/alpha crystallin family protein [Desulfovibrionaceae bacterium]|nr:Hsp20/alpha crystallin family protein [Desulfovibrionaceae bacterium]
MPYFIPARKNMRENYHGVSRLHDDIDRLFGGVMFPGNWMRTVWPEAGTVNAQQADFMPQIDVISNEAAYTMRLELPGVAPEDVNIKVADNVLTVSGEKKAETADEVQTHVQERSFGTFSRSLTLPEDADMESIRAFSKNGVLSVEIPRRKPEAARTRTIEVQRG